MDLLDDIKELAKFFGISSADEIDDSDIDVEEFLSQKKESPDAINQPQPSTSSSNGFSRVKKDVSKDLQDKSYEFLKQLRGKPYGSFIPFEHNGTKYKAVLEEHIGGSHTSGKHPGISLFIENQTFVDRGNKVQFGSDTFDKIESSKFDNEYRIPSTGALVSSHGVVTKTHPDGHKGIDIGANKGTPVYSIGPGYVKSVTSERSNPKGGLTVTTTHDNNIESYYAHLDSINVRVGQKVDENTIIGTIGDSGMIYNGQKRKTAPHLHWEVKVNGRNINPLDVKNF